MAHEQLARWRGGERIQNVMPFLSADDREFIMTGITATWRWPKRKVPGLRS